MRGASAALLGPVRGRDSKTKGRFSSASKGLSWSWNPSGYILFDMDMKPPVDMPACIN